MGVPPPLGRERVEPALHDAYDRVQSESGTVPNIFRVMAHFPAALKRFIPFYTAVMSQGSVPRKFKELAYLKTAHINACGYCMAAHTHSALEAGVSRAQIDSIRVYQGSDAFDE
jgi:AhpD family alkylhydroperoxidase